MAFSVQMPALGESVTEGTVTRWLKREGDHVDVDEPLLEVSTDKVDTEIPSPAAGVLSRIVVAEDETVEVGAELAVIDDPGAGGGNGQPAQTQAEPAAEQPAQTEQPAAEQEPEPEQPEPEQPESEPQQQARHQAPERTEPEPQQPQPDQQPSRQPAATGNGQGSGDGTPVTMPALGESVTEGTVTRWLKQVGDHVDVDEPLLEVSTDKVDTEIPSPAAGTLLEISVDEDQTVEVGAQLAVIGSGQPAQQQAAPDTRPDEAREPEPPAQQAQAEPTHDLVAVVARRRAPHRRRGRFKRGGVPRRAPGGRRRPGGGPGADARVREGGAPLDAGRRQPAGRPARAAGPASPPSPGSRGLGRASGTPPPPPGGRLGPRPTGTR